MRHALAQAGFPLVGAADPGLAVREAPNAVLVKWTASDTFTALAQGHPRATGDSMQAIVQAAVAGLLLQLGHTVTETPDGGGLLVRADE
ncbi:hypothetical protein [Streptomyces sp. SLBN-31]|uniref:hypothetical protein n=1 Tax=Streptomyces sp. SLBN-31 TaxID=2768444 RepID=UPI00114EA0F1|nr:hypothetical protein [Streptomyces sp. SLBN-31]